MTRADLKRGGVAASGAVDYEALDRRVTELDRIATLAASSSRTLADLVREAPRLLDLSIDDRSPVVAKRMGVSPDLLCDLREIGFTVVTIRPKRVQRLLGRAKSSYIQRGASAWCSQALGAVRDHLCRCGFTLLSDMDGVELLVGPSGRSPDEVRRQVGDYLGGHNAGPRLTEGFPRLFATLRQADAEGRSARPLFPDLAVSLASANLLDFALGASLWDPDYNAADSPEYQEVTSQPPVGRDLQETACVGMVGDEPLRDERFHVPPWYAETEAHERYSLAATAYSLAGAGYRTTTAQGLLDAVREATGRRLHAESREGDRLRKLEAEIGAGVRTLFLVRADGNDIGRRFVETPPLLRPGLANLLEAELRQRFTRAVIELVRQQPDTSVLPVDLIYLGGDDLQFTVVDRLLDPLLELLFDAAPVARRGVPDLRIKLAAVEYPATRDHAEREKGRDSVIRAPDALPRHVWAHQAADRIITAAKEGLDPGTAEAEVLLESMNQGFPLPDEWRWELARRDRPGWQALVLRRAGAGDQDSRPRGDSGPE